MVFRETDESRMIKEKTRLAVSLAMEGKWKEAAEINREILDSSPENTESLNRLGKALIELNQIENALAAFNQVLAINPSNTIAAKNAERLNWACSNKSKAKPLSSTHTGSLTAKFFIGQSGKSTEVTLTQCSANYDPSPGTPIMLKVEGSAIVAMDPCNNRLGYVPSKLSRRLVCLMQGGNTYDGAISGGTGDELRVVLRESFQHPSQRSKVSFPPTASWDENAVAKNDSTSAAIENEETEETELEETEFSAHSSQHVLA